MDAQNSTSSAPERRVVGRPFQKGVSGNPGGRSKDDIDVAALARSKGAKAIAALERALDDPKHYVAAAIALLDRGYGRPKQTIDGDAATSFTLAHFLAAKTVSALGLAELAQQDAATATAAPLIEAAPRQNGATPSNGTRPSMHDIFTPADE